MRSTSSPSLQTWSWSPWWSSSSPPRRGFSPCNVAVPGLPQSPAALVDLCFAAGYRAAAFFSALPGHFSPGVAASVLLLPYLLYLAPLFRLGDSVPRSISACPRPACSPGMSLPAPAWTRNRCRPRYPRDQGRLRGPRRRSTPCRESGLPGRRAGSWPARWRLRGGDRIAQALDTQFPEHRCGDAPGEIPLPEVLHRRRRLRVWEYLGRFFAVLDRDGTAFDTGSGPSMSKKRWMIENAGNGTPPGNGQDC